MRVFLLFILLTFKTILHSFELDKSVTLYPPDYSSGNLSKINKSVSIEGYKYQQKVVLDHDNVYRLKTFKKKISVTPEILRNIINLEANLAVQNKSKFANRNKNTTNAL